MISKLIIVAVLAYSLLHQIHGSGTISRSDDSGSLSTSGHEGSRSPTKPNSEPTASAKEQGASIQQDGSQIQETIKRALTEEGLTIAAEKGEEWHFKPELLVASCILVVVIAATALTLYLRPYIAKLRTWMDKNVKASNKEIGGSLMSPRLWLVDMTKTFHEYTEERNSESHVGTEWPY